jgi:hypothetical protein
MDVFKEIGLTKADYAHAHPILTKALVTLHKEMLPERKKQGKKAEKKQRRKQEVIEPVTSIKYPFRAATPILNEDYIRKLFGRDEAQPTTSTSGDKIIMENINAVD